MPPCISTALPPRSTTTTSGRAVVLYVAAILYVIVTLTAPTNARADSTEINTPSATSMTPTGPIVGTGSDGQHGRRRTQQIQSRDTTNPQPDPPEPSPTTQMVHRLATPEGKAAYSQRGHIAETPHGHIKHNLGFRRLTMRGTTRASAEWTFLALTTNLLKVLPLIHPTTHRP